ncbi:MAG TPA: hypothetical protein VN081_00660 [Dongiaceae bacterium]|nr:hypothetical protein [Dongiaceae bacterium]
MVHKANKSAQWRVPIVIGVSLLALFVFPAFPAHAINQLPTPDPQPGSFGLEATKPQPAPTVGATITTPGSGASYATSPITVNGICPNDLLVQLYDNGVMVGSVMCNNGSFSLQVSLFAGANELSAIVYDNLEQAGPTSNVVAVTYTDTHLAAFGSLMTLTSSYGRRSAAAGGQLSWPLQLSGGSSPYAFDIDWGDGSSADLKSQPSAGVVAIDHVYKGAGIYQANVRVADANGVSAFLQVVAVANGQVDSSTAGSANGANGTNGSGSGQTVTKVLWIPAAISFVLLLPTFWLGRQSQVISLRNKMLKERDSYEKK